MKVNLLPFNNASYQLIVAKGYNYISIEPRMDKKYASFFHEREFQLLKAVNDNDQQSCNGTCEPIHSEVIKELLRDDVKMDCFVILT